MPRPFRLDHPGALWHVYNRGVDRRSIFLDDGDRTFFRDLLARVCHDYKWLVLSYTEMTNHYHVFVQTVEPTLSRGMQALDGDFAARGFLGSEPQIGGFLGSEPQIENFRSSRACPIRVSKPHGALRELR